MVDETAAVQPPAISRPEDLSSFCERLTTDLNAFRDDLDQTLIVWRADVEKEKREFLALLDAQRTIWEKQDEESQRERQAYEQKITELETYFNDQLATTEQNALRALNELDDAWQDDKKLWQTSQVERNQAMQDLRASHAAELADLESRLHASEEARLAQRRQVEEYIANLESQISALHAFIEQTFPAYPLRRPADQPIPAQAPV